MNMECFGLAGRLIIGSRCRCMKRIILIIFLLITTDFTMAETPGLAVGSDGTLVKAGKAYRGIGVNYFDCFLRTLKKAEDTSYDAGFAELGKRGIPFARFCATGFWPKDMQLYQTDRAEYFRRMDGVVQSASKHGVGLIPSLFWHHACVPDLVGESMDQWANPESKTQAWMRQYVSEVVIRYRDNPTIWAWELGNEFSLQADLPNAKEHRPAVHPTLGTAASRSERDEMTFAMVRAVFAAFGREVRKHDPHRLILTGDSFPRLSAWHQEHEDSWKKDTPEQFAEMLASVNPDPINGIGLHAYEDDDQRFASAMEVSVKLKKPIFIGEFGAQGESPEQAAKFRRLLSAIELHGIPLAAVWVFDLANQPDFTITTTNARAWQLELISETNQRLQATGATLIPQSGLLLDLDADKGVETDASTRVTKWLNQAPGEKAREFVPQPKGRKDPTSGMPVLRKSVAELGGRNSITFLQQELLCLEDDTFDVLTTGKGHTWITLLSVKEQRVGLKDVNSFFGNLRNGRKFEGVWGCLNDDNTLWWGARNGITFGRFDANNPQAVGPKLETGKWHVIAGRMGAGTGTVKLELFVDQPKPVSSVDFPVSTQANPSRMAIGQERDAIEHPGVESFDGEISRFLIWERPLSDSELAQVMRSVAPTVK